MSGLVYQYERPTGLSDIIYTLESSPDLSPGSWVTDPAVPSVTPLGGGREQVGYDLPGGGNSRFYRLRVDLL